MKHLNPFGGLYEMPSLMTHEAGQRIAQNVFTHLGVSTLDAMSGRVERDVFRTSMTLGGQGDSNARIQAQSFAWHPATGSGTSSFDVSDAMAVESVLPRPWYGDDLAAGTCIAITRQAGLKTIAVDKIILAALTSDPGSPAVGEMWLRTDL